MGSRVCSFRVGAKHFFFDFDGGRTAPYHITEKRGRFVGSLWLGWKSLHWLIEAWSSLRQTADLKGFFRFLRTEYSTLELSCLQNQYGRFVEICEYHGGAQRGGIRIPEGFWGKHWDHFVKELHSFFPGTAVAAEHQAGKSRNGERKTNMERREIRANPSHADSEFRNGQIALKSRNTRDFKNQSAGIFTAEVTRVKMDPNAPRPTRMCDFKWKPVTKTLRITKCFEGKRQAEWVGLKTKAIGLAQQSNQVITQAQLMENGSVDKKKDVEPSVQCPEQSLPSSPAVDHVDEKEDLDSSDEESHADEELEYSDEEIQADDLESTLEKLATESSHNPMGELLMEPGCTAVEEEEPRAMMDLALVRVDLAEDVQGTVTDLESGSSLVHEEYDPRFEEVACHSQLEVAQDEAEPISPLVCEPLAVLAPTTILAAPGKPHSTGSEWVNTQYRGICELMGFPLDSHGKQCLALLRRIEASRFRKKGELGSKSVVCSGKKGVRELRNLVSSVNYEGRQRACC